MSHERVDGFARADIGDDDVGADLLAIAGSDADDRIALEEEALHADAGAGFAAVLRDGRDDVFGKRGSASDGEP